MSLISNRVNDSGSLDRSAHLYFPVCPPMVFFMSLPIITSSEMTSFFF